MLSLLGILFVFIGTVVSVLGYCLIPIVGIAGLSVLFSLTGMFALILQQGLTDMFIKSAAIAS